MSEQAEMPEPPRAEIYPPYVSGEEQRRRWDLAAAIARRLFGEAGEAQVWMATRSIYRSEIETGRPFSEP